MNGKGGEMANPEFLSGGVGNNDPESFSGSRLRMNTANHATQNTLLGGPLGGPPFFVRSSLAIRPNGRAADLTFLPTETEPVHR